MKNYILGVLLLAMPYIGFAKKDSLIYNRKQTLFAEFGGTGVLYSLNYEYLTRTDKKMPIAYRVGIHYSTRFRKLDRRFIVVPLEASLLLPWKKRKNSFWELGLGVNFLDVQDITCAEDKLQCFDETALVIVPRLGYRYQNNKNGLFMKVGFTPLYDALHWGPGITHSSPEAQSGATNIIIPFGGVGVGYSF